MVGPGRTRRSVLVSTGLVAGLAGLAGCRGTRPGGEPGETDTPTDTPTDTATASSTGTAGGEATPTESTPADGTPTVRKESVQFQSTAGTQVTATVFRGSESSCGIVLVPQINLDRESWNSQAEELRRRGHLALAIDEDPDNLAESVLGAIEYLRTEEAVDNVLLVGASSGGKAVVLANARSGTDAVVGVVTLSAAAPDNLAEVAGKLRGQKLFVVSENDSDRFVQTAKKLHEKAPEPKALKIYSGSAHGQRIFGTKHGDDLAGRLYAIVEDVC